ncbi:MAG: response regulator [Lachnospiraceae bacterium]|nr:response regulator [Lachnospiraceae bacterium]
MKVLELILSGGYYFSIAAIGFIILFFVVAGVNGDVRAHTRIMMNRTALIALFGCLAEMVSTIASNLDEVPVLTKTILFSANMSLMFLCSMYFDRYTFAYLFKDEDTEERGRKFIYTNSMIVVAFHVVLLGNFFYPIIFWYDDMGVHQGPLYILMGYVAPAFYLVIGLLGIYLQRKKLLRREFHALLSIHIIVLLGAFLQAILNDAVLLVSYAIAVGLYIVNSFLESKDYHMLVETNIMLEDAEHRANEANRSKSAFLSSMSHEIRTPMNAVLGLNEMTRMTLTDDAQSERERIEKSLEYSESIKSAGEALLYVINDILDISKIESGKLDVVTAPYHMKTLLEELNSVFSYQAEGKGLMYICHIDGDLPGYVEGDKLRVRQVITNVINNAIKYTNTGTVSLDVAGVVKGDEVRYDISVTDTGIGIKPESLPHLFDAFTRVDDSETHYIEGTGLGLTIVKRLLKLMGGDVEVESTYGKGSVFTIHLPQKILSGEKISEYSKEQDKAKEKAETFSAEGFRILVVDDNAMNRAVAKNFLEKMHAAVETASSGPEGLEMIRGKHYDVVLLDHMMPDMGGDEVLHIIRQHPEEFVANAETPIIALTANAQTGLREKYINEYGFTDYMAKPFRYQDMVALLRAYLK